MASAQHAKVDACALQRPALNALGDPRFPARPALTLALATSSPLISPPKAGVVRRCLSILSTAAATSPGGPAAVGLLQPAMLAALVRLLAGRLSGSSSGTEVEEEAAGLLLAISRWGASFEWA